MFAKLAQHNFKRNNKRGNFERPLGRNRSFPALQRQSAGPRRHTGADLAPHAAVLPMAQDDFRHARVQLA